MLHDLQDLIEHKEEIAEEAGLENDMSFNSGVKEETMNTFQELLNNASKYNVPNQSSPIWHIVQLVMSLGQG